MGVVRRHVVIVSVRIVRAVVVLIVAVMIVAVLVGIDPAERVAPNIRRLVAEGIEVRRVAERVSRPVSEYVPVVFVAVVIHENTQ